VLLDASPHKARRIENLQREISNERKMIFEAGGKPDLNSKSTTLSKNWDLLNDLVAGDCIYCGEVMINSLDKPFVTQEDIPWD
jgi:hypothetical protein